MEEDVVVGFHDVVVRVGEDVGERGEKGVGFAGVHVLGAVVEDDDVVVAEEFERDEKVLVGFGKVTEDEVEVNGGRRGGEWGGVKEAEEVAVRVVVWESEDGDEKGEVVLGLKKSSSVGAGCCCCCCC